MVVVTVGKRTKEEGRRTKTKDECWKVMEEMFLQFTARNKSTVMCTRVETKRKENFIGLWVRSRIYSTGIVYSHSVSVHTVQMQ